jgi:peptide/nickel transport system ATP-binding protein
MADLARRTERGLLSERRRRLEPVASGGGLMAGSGTAHLRGDAAFLTVRDLVVEFPAGKGQKVHAVSKVSFDLLPGETLGLVGESGCGKSTTGRAVVQLVRPTSGSVRFRGRELVGMAGRELREVRREMQMIFQDPVSSLNPRRRVKDIVAEPLAIWPEAAGDSREDKVRAMFEAVGLDYDSAGSRRPHEFSGGQCQRISIARALMLSPDLLICDEPVSALDVSVQAQILNLLRDMRERYSLTMIFIAHDLAVVKNISDRVAVMYLGKVCEVAPVDDLYGAPAHPYTSALLASVPEPDPSRPPVSQEGLLGAELPSPIDPPSGCRFRTRCPVAQDVCSQYEPEIREVAPGHFAACHFPQAAPVSIGGAFSPMRR